MERVMAGPQPPQWLVSEVHQRIVLFLNHVLMQEKEATERLVRQKGRVARVQWRGYSMALQITPAGLFNVAPEDAQPDLLLEVTETSALALAQVALRGDKPSIRIEGDVQLAAEDRAHRGDAGIGRQRGDDPARIGNGGLGIERQRPPRREANLEAARHEQVAKRRPHAAREHDHVQQHRRRHGDARHRQQRATFAGEAHQRPISDSGCCATSRRAATYPAASPSTTESPTARR